ncbi:MAG: hypothetical protein V7744_08960 [Pseudomonadales bacterium]
MSFMDGLKDLFSTSGMDIDTPLPNANADVKVSVATNWNGDAKLISSRTPSDTFQQATEWADGNLMDLEDL